MTYHIFIEIYRMILTILITKGQRLLSLAALVDVFETVNRFLQEEGADMQFDIRFTGSSKASELPAAYQQYPYSTADACNDFSDYVFIPAFSSDQMPQAVHQNLDLLPFLISQHQRGASLISLCTGSFLLAAGGLLDGKQATTHVEASDRFAQSFPRVRLQPHAVVTQDGKIFTSGGATSSFHAKLYIIQQACGREMAIRVAKTFAIDMDRTNQLYFDHFRPALSDEDELVRAVQIAINQKYSELKNVEEALEEIPSSRRNLIRRFKSATGMTPIRYLQKTKIEAAKNQLEKTNKDILSVMLDSGYNDMKNFRQLFKSFTGLTPKDYRDKYGMRLH